jgi:hypothetical protein
MVLLLTLDALSDISPDGQNAQQAATHDLVGRKRIWCFLGEIGANAEPGLDLNREPTPAVVSARTRRAT